MFIICSLGDKILEFSYREGGRIISKECQIMTEIADPMDSGQTAGETAWD